MAKFSFFPCSEFKASKKVDLLDVKFILIFNRKLEPFSAWCINDDFERAASLEASCIACFVNYLMTSETEETPGIL